MVIGSRFCFMQKDMSVEIVFKIELTGETQIGRVEISHPAASK